MTKKKKEKIFKEDDKLNYLKETYFRLAKNEQVGNNKETKKIDKLEEEIRDRMKFLIDENT